MQGIFISYRREDSAGHAGRLFDRLIQHFGKDRVFMDVSDIAPGTDFVEAIDTAVGSCEVLIVIIGRQWLSCTEPDGTRRLDNSHDFIRLEAATALSRNVRVIPVLVQGARMPKAAELPADLEKLSRRQAIEISDNRWDSDVGQLIRACDAIVSRDATSRSEAPLENRAVNEQRNRKTVGAFAAIISLVALAIGGWWFWPQKVGVPSVVGITLERAKELLADRGLTLGGVSEEQSEAAAAGTILKQQPEAGTRAAKGASIAVVVAAVVRVAVPDVVRRDVTEAESILTKQGLQIGKKSTKTSAEIQPGAVLSQSPSAGERVAKNSQVDLVVAAIPRVSVPDLNRVSLQEGRRLLENAGLLLGDLQKRETSEPVREETVLQQSPRAGQQVDKGTRVNLVVSARPALVSVPDVLGKPVEEVRVLLGKIGLSVGAERRASSTRPVGTVLRQTPTGGERVAWGTKVDLTVAVPVVITEAVPALPVVIRSKGQLTIPEGRAADLDEGTVGSRVEADIGFPLRTSGERYVEPLNGALIAIVPRVSPDGKSCGAAKKAALKLALADLPQNTLVCVRTNQGRNAYFRVMETVGPAPATLKIGYVTWE